MRACDIKGEPKSLRHGDNILHGVVLSLYLDVQKIYLRFVIVMLMSTEHFYENILKQLWLHSEL